MKLFVKGNKERPILFEGARELQGWISFISKHCPELGAGHGLTAAQWSAYAVKHQLVRRRAVGVPGVDPQSRSCRAVVGCASAVRLSALPM